jgi:hypothetical protein
VRAEAKRNRDKFCALCGKENLTFETSTLLQVVYFLSLKKQHNPLRLKNSFSFRAFGKVARFM